MISHNSNTSPKINAENKIKFSPTKSKNKKGKKN